MRPPAGDFFHFCEVPTFQGAPVWNGPPRLGELSARAARNRHTFPRCLPAPGPFFWNGQGPDEQAGHRQRRRPASGLRAVNALSGRSFLRIVSALCLERVTLWLLALASAKATGFHNSVGQHNRQEHDDDPPDINMCNWT